MRRTAHVLTAGRDSMPDSGEDVIRVVTDYPRKDESGLYLAADSPVPEVGAEITWGDRRVWYGGHEVRKRGYAFNPWAPLR